MGHLKAAIFDISKTTLADNGSLQPGMAEVIRQFQTWGIEIFFASNKRSVCAQLQRVISVPDNRLLYLQKVNGSKGTGAFVRYVCSELSISQNSLLYLGDDQVDMQESVNNDVLLFLAQWTDSTQPYGIPVKTPEQFLETLQTFFLKDTLWYFAADGVDQLNRPILARALIDPDKAYATGIRTFLKDKGKNGPKQIKGYSPFTYFSVHLIASIYLEGLHVRGGPGKSVWCMYPGHDKMYTNAISAFTHFISRLFKDPYFEDLIIRHAESIPSHTARFQKEEVPITNQIQTIHINPAYHTRIQKKHIIVLDDFTTNAQAFETARNMLLNCGAESVIGVAVGKFGKWYCARSPFPNIQWNSLVPCSLTKDDFNEKYIAGVLDDTALKYF